MDLYNVGSPVFAASYYCPFALIRGPTRVSVRVCNIAVDPMGPRGVTHVPPHLWTEAISTAVTHQPSIFHLSIG